MTSDTPTKVVSLRLRSELAREFKMEAARRGLKLNAMFEDMLRLYLESGESTPRDERGGSNG